MNSENNNNATQVDSGWRSNSSVAERKSTQVDESWRKKTETIDGKATEVDEGWRTTQGTATHKATEVDEGWRNSENSSNAVPTEVDTGWRGAKPDSDRKATEIDEGWRKDAINILDPSNVMNKATANYFLTIEDFKEAVAKLSELTSSTNNIYHVKKTISKAGGEAIILMCSDTNGNDVVAKVYYEPVNSAGSSISARTRVLDYMGTEEGKKYTLPVIEIGLVEFGSSRYYFEIMPYCDEGDVSDDGAFSFEELVTLTRHLNEALHSIHNAGILHRDIKPQNIYKTKKGIVLGDFGTAKIAENGMSSQTSHVVGTDGYTAPELRLGLTNSPTFFYTSKIDYYSLGVTLGTLFEGHFVYDGMDDGMIYLSVQKGKLPLTRIDPHREQLENLINGLCRFDQRYRFGYEEVNKWLADHNYTGGGIEEEWPKSFRMLGEEYRDEQSMFQGLTKDEEHWKEAKELLYTKTFEDFFRSFRTDLSRAAQVADELYRGEQADKGLTVFLKSLFAPGPIVWKGYTFNSLSELGSRMLTTKNPLAYSELLQNHCISHWLSNTEGITAEENTKKLVDDIEKLSSSEPEIACYWFGNSFASEKELKICDCTVHNVEQLMEALFSSPNTFYQTDGYNKLLNRNEGAELYGFLFSFGYKELIDKEWEHLGQADMFNKTVVIFSMLEEIALKADISPTIIREFFLKFGPIGIATYTKSLIDKSDDAVYLALDADGKQILSKINEFSANKMGSINEIFRAYTPLLENVEKLRTLLIDNPFCIETGVYENKGIICTNLVGCFAFKIFERIAPLGFNALLETTKGGIK